MLEKNVLPAATLLKRFLHALQTQCIVFCLLGDGFFLFPSHLGTLSYDGICPYALLFLVPYGFVYGGRVLVD